MASGKELPPPAKASPVKPNLRLRIVASENPELYGREIVLGAQKSAVGRDPASDLVLVDSSISRHHASIEKTADGGLLVRDLGSRNGLFLLGQKVAEAKVKPGQVFSLGKVTFEVLADKPPAPKKGPAEIPGTQVVTDLTGILRKALAGGPLEAEGEPIEPGKGWRLEVDDDPDSVWLVAAGAVELFVVRAGDDVAAKRHLFTVHAGQVIFGMGPSASVPLRLRAEAQPGTRILRFDAGNLQRLALIPAHRARIAQMVSGWLRAMGAVLTAQRSPPPTGFDAVAGKGVRLPNEGVLRSGGDVCWLEIAPGLHLTLVDDVSFSHDVEGLLFPLPPGGWLSVYGGSAHFDFKPETTLDEIHDARLWAGMARFQEGFRRSLPWLAVFQQASDIEMIHRRSAEEQVARGEALQAFESVLAGNESFRPPPAATEAAGLLTVCQEIGRVQGITVRSNPFASANATLEDGLRDIATVSGFQVRRIRLGDQWWRSDQGPMLAEKEGGAGPVALLPSSSVTYEVFDPSDGSRRPATAETTLALSGFGFAFYRPLPAEKLDRWTFLRFARRELGKDAWWLAATSLVTGLAGTAVPMVTGMVFDSAIPQAQASGLRDLCLGLLAMAFGSLFFQAVQKVSALRIQGKVDYALQSALWSRLLNLPTTFFRRFSAGDLADRAAGVSKIRGILAGAGIGAALGLVTALFNAVQMLSYSGSLFAAAAGISLAYTLSTVLFNYMQVGYQRKELDLSGYIRGFVLQLIAGVSKLRVQGAESHAFRAWAREFSSQRKLTMRARFWSTGVLTLSAGFPLLATSLLFLLLHTLSEGAKARGESLDFSTGDFLAFMAAFGLFQAALQALGDASVGLLQVVPNLERLDPILETVPETSAAHRHPGQLKGRLTLNSIRFRYNESGPWLIDDLSLDIAPGEFVAIVGSSGSGKSTLLRLLLGFESPQIGAVLFDGQDLASLDVKAVRRQLGVVLQDSRVLPAEIYRNIVGASARTLEEAWEAARKAGIDKDIRQMPMNMHTYVSEGGGTLSGGQRQRLMIARALVDEPKILIFDEATSALDNHAQSIVTQSMQQLKVTRIVIAHRLSTIQDADKICYLEGGRIVEQGNFQQLMALNGRFAAMAQRQLD